MKNSIIIGGEEFEYRYHYTKEDKPGTRFYRINYKSIIWGLLKTKTRDNAFIVPMWILDPQYAKETINNIVIEAYKDWKPKYDLLKAREKEIKEGNII